MAGGKKGALEGRWTLWFLDESGARLTPLVGRTWAPRGETPELHHNFGKWEKVGMISAVGTTRRLYFRFKLQEAIDHGDVARFLEHLLGHVPGELVVFLDGARQHRGLGIDGVLERHPRLRLEFLPPYGFDYNPDEGVWDHLKWVQLRNFTPHDTGEQVGALRKGLRVIQRRPGLIASFFRKSKLPRRDVELLLKKAGGL